MTKDEPTPKRRKEKKEVDNVKKELQEKLTQSMLSARTMFLANYGRRAPTDEKSQSILLQTKIAHEYEHIKDIGNYAPREEAADPTPVVTTGSTKTALQEDAAEPSEDVEIADIIEKIPDKNAEKDDRSTALVEFQKMQNLPEHLQAHHQLILRQRQRMKIKPKWHAPWKVYRVISGHLGWVRSIAVDHTNEWFVTGSADRTIKIWDLASGALKLTLTGHISAVRGLAVSPRHPYLFSAGEDKLVKCWDLEYNKVVRSYHGHLSGVYSMALHPTLDVLLTGGRDSSCRVWDIRTKAEARMLAGHTHTVADIIVQGGEPQVTTGSHDATIRLWDLSTGKAMSVLTNHKKSVRALTQHPREYTFCSGSADNIKIWKYPEGKFLRNHVGHNTIINSLCVNHDNVLVSGGDNGSMNFWDWKTGYSFQQHQTVVQPGSIDSEAGIFDMKFDMTGTRLITAEADKTIKIYKEDENATEESHPINYRPPKKRPRY